MSAFRDVQSKFADKNAQVLGVSMDDLDTQKRFAQSLNLPFPLAADPKGTTAEAYGVRHGDHPDRVTFVIGPDGKVLKRVEGRDAVDPNPALEACPLHHGKDRAGAETLPADPTSPRPGRRNRAGCCAARLRWPRSAAVAGYRAPAARSPRVRRRLPRGRAAAASLRRSRS